MLSLFFFRALIAGGGAPEIELSLKLMEYANTLTGIEQYCFRAFADALEVIPFTLAENAGLNPIATVTELRTRHALGERTAGINVRKVINITIICTFYTTLFPINVPSRTVKVLLVKLICLLSRVLLQTFWRKVLFSLF